MEQTVYLETLGCQMNKLDAELIRQRLGQEGYRFTLDADQAGVIIFVTCSVRQRAEDKVLSKIGQLRRRHDQQKDLILAVAGCMAERLGPALFDLHPQVDVVCAPGRIHQLGELIARARHERRRQVALNDPAEQSALEDLDASRRQTDADHPFMAYLRVMRGCNKFCSYCVVPYVRGREVSRPPESIVAEAQRLADRGVKEITLLGQTVNSYCHRNGTTTVRLADLLARVHEIAGLERLRFVTSYPRDFDERLLAAMADLPKVCEYLHLPAQSGSDRILAAMNRRYTAGQYLDLIERARQRVPGIAVAGDFIVGFPGEREEDFEATCELMRRVRYKNCFIFKYSPRPGTRADGDLADDVPTETKRRRNQILLDLQEEISLADNQAFVGQTVEILVEGPSKNPHLDEGRTGPADPAYSRSLGRSGPADSGSIQLVGRTRGDHIVVLQARPDRIGRIVPVRVVRASALTLFAEPVR
ncbi:MAG: tRNA (N6-isopentenyl adenosine(37)-C2)-methylthiotransferase MiaB [Sedimentisphaerales bacterium]|nr:tRNA (N6-isopentenyl adenosine(37)-C2)-methylthiotransferase MiaB [Sedimentisphaerales bacterium]